MIPARAVAVTALALLVPSCGSGEEDGAAPPSAASGQDPQTPSDRPGPVPEGAPRVRMALTGSMLGTLEPCGCAQAQIGGLARRMFHLRQDGDFDLRIEGGNMAGGGTVLDGRKFLTALQALYFSSEDQSYDAQAVGPRDLVLARQDLLQFTAGLEVPLVTADLVAELPEGGPWVAEPYREFEVRGQKVRVSALTLAVPEGVGGFSLRPPGDAWAAAMAGADPETLRLVIVHGTSARVRGLATSLEPAPDLVVGCNDEHPEPPPEPDSVDGVPVVFPGSEGRCVLEVTLARLPDGPRLGYHVERLEGSRTRKGFMEDRDVRSLLDQHRQDVAESDVLQEMAGRNPLPDGLRYVGSESCRACHQAAYEVWESSRHAHAWETLVAAEEDPERYGWPVTEYPDCVACHSIGYGDESGFVDFETTPGLADVGCEECHGPGSAHVADPTVVMGPVGAKSCTECHDHDQTPDFDYGERWPVIEHGK